MKSYSIVGAAHKKLESKSNSRQGAGTDRPTTEQQQYFGNEASQHYFMKSTMAGNSTPSPKKRIKNQTGKN